MRQVFTENKEKKIHEREQGKKLEKKENKYSANILNRPHISCFFKDVF
jgi:hypothetical protein